MQTQANSIKWLRTTAQLLRGGLAVGLGGLAVAGLTGVLRLAVRQAAGPGAHTPAEWLTVLAAGAALALLLWLLLAVVLETLSAAPGSLGRAAAAVHARVTPAALRRVSSLLIGASIGAAGLPAAVVGADQPVRPGAAAVVRAGAPVPGFATTNGTAPAPGFTGTGPSATGTRAGTAPAPGWPSAPTPPAPAPGFAPTRPLVRDVLAPTVLAPSPAPRTDGVVVLRGDTLWSIAAEHLGPGATEAEIADAWPHWYAANRTVIGPDPDLIRPGQVLTAPVRSAR